MENLKKFVNFVEKNNEFNILDKMNKLPSELWTSEMMEKYSKHEDNISNDIDNDHDTLHHYNDEDDDENSFLMNNNSDSNLTEKYSEEEDYELIDVFDKKEEKKDE